MDDEGSYPSANAKIPTRLVPAISGANKNLGKKRFPQIKMSDWFKSPSDLEKKFRLMYFISFIGKNTK